MADYKVIGNSPFSDLVGGKLNAELILKGMNINKTIAVKLGAEHNPPYIWNKNMPLEWCHYLVDKTAIELKKDINWKPDEVFIDECRKHLLKEV